MPRDKSASIAAARKLLGDERLLAFLHALYAWQKEQNGGHVIGALSWAVKHLNSGRTLDELFAPWNIPGETLDLGHTLSAKKLRDGRYKIEFGCAAGGNCGDGGEWNVAFGAQGEVLSIESLGFWIA